MAKIVNRLDRSLHIDDWDLIESRTVLYITWCVDLFDRRQSKIAPLWIWRRRCLHMGSNWVYCNWSRKLKRPYMAYWVIVNLLHRFKAIATGRWLWHFLWAAAFCLNAWSSNLSICLKAKIILNLINKTTSRRILSFSNRQSNSKVRETSAFYLRISLSWYLLQGTLKVDDDIAYPGKLSLENC